MDGCPPDPPRSHTLSLSSIRCHSVAMKHISPRHAAAVATLCEVLMPGCCPKLQGVRKQSTTSSSTSASVHDNTAREHIIILGGGIAGLSTARYLLQHTQHAKSTRITLIDRNVDILPSNNTLSSSSSYEQQICDQLHYSIPSRRNGNVLCPSLTIPWTTRSLWKEAFFPGLKSILGSSDRSSSSITFDWSSLVMDRDMVCFSFSF